MLISLHVPGSALRQSSLLYLVHPDARDSAAHKSAWRLACACGFHQLTAAHVQRSALTDCTGECLLTMHRQPCEQKQDCCSTQAEFAQQTSKAGLATPPHLGVWQARLGGRELSSRATLPGSRSALLAWPRLRPLVKVNLAIVAFGANQRTCPSPADMHEVRFWSA